MEIRFSNVSGRCNDVYLLQPLVAVTEWCPRAEAEGDADPAPPLSPSRARKPDSMSEDEDLFSDDLSLADSDDDG